MIRGAAGGADNDRKMMSAMELKARELYGASAEKYGINNNKRDGALMSSNADWKNVHIDSTNQASPMKAMNQD